MELVIVRHGETNWNAEGRMQGHHDIELNRNGLLQAERVATRLAAESWDVVVSSDLQRAWMTATTIARAIGMYDHDVIKDNRLRERCFGQLEGTTLQERVRRWGEDWILKEHGIESDQAVNQRVKLWMMEVEKQYPHGRIIVVSHGGVIKRWLEDWFPDQRIERIGNTSVTVLRKSEGQWSQKLVNCTAHLE